MVLLNALHFQGLWKVPFDAKMTEERLFTCANGSQVPVPMMRLVNRFHYGESRVPQGYSGIGLQCMIVLTHIL